MGRPFFGRYAGAGRSSWGDPQEWAGPPWGRYAGVGRPTLRGYPGAGRLSLRGHTGVARSSWGDTEGRAGPLGGDTQGRPGPPGGTRRGGQALLGGDTQGWAGPPWGEYAGVGGPTLGGHAGSCTEIRTGAFFCVNPKAPRIMWCLQGLERPGMTTGQLTPLLCHTEMGSHQGDLFLLLTATLEFRTRGQTLPPNHTISSVPQAEPSPLALISPGLWQLALNKELWVGI